MARYFFHLRDGQDVLMDPEGREIDDVALIPGLALKDARSMISQDALTGRIHLQQAIEVLDEKGAVVFKAETAPLTLDNQKGTIAAPEENIVATFEIVFNTTAAQTLALVTTSTDGTIIQRPMPTITLVEAMPVYTDVAAPVYTPASIIPSTSSGFNR